MVRLVAQLGANDRMPGRARVILWRRLRRLWSRFQGRRVAGRQVP